MIKWAEGFMHWVSLNERLPPVDEQILICSGPLQTFYIGFYMSEGRVMKEDFWIVRNEYAEELMGVTHWMALPKPPEEK